MPGWTKEEKDLATEMAGKNHTATEIAETLKNRSRNSVIGFLHREGVPFGKPKPKNHNLEELRRATQRKMIARRNALAAKKAVVVVPPTRSIFEQSQSQLQASTNAKEKGKVRFIERLPFQCAYIPGEVKGADTLCCGAVVKGTSSWCEHHYPLMLVPIMKRPRQSPTPQRDRG